MGRRAAPTDTDRLARIAGEPARDTGASSPWRLELPEDLGEARPEPDELVARTAPLRDGSSEALGDRPIRSPLPPATAGRHRDTPPPVTALPARLVDARWQPRWTAVLAVLAILLSAGVVFGVRVAMARGQAEPQPVPRASAPPRSGAEGVTRSAGPTTGVETVTSGVATAGPAASTPTSSPGGAPVIVDVAGQVSRRGVVRLPAGARVVDALAAAGGPLPTADLTAVNQARILVDGELVYLPRPGETPPAAVVPGQGAMGAAAPGGAAGRSASGGGAPGGGGAGAAPGAPIDLNTATAEQLDGLPGVGPAIAARILEWRSQHGRFSSVEELGEVQGIGPKLLERLRPQVRV